jgi:hypothetical protein
MWDGTKQKFYDLAQSVFGPSGFTYFIVDNGDLSIDIGILGPAPPTPILTALLNSGALDVKPVTIRINSRTAQQGPLFALGIESLLFSGFGQGYWEA